MESVLRSLSSMGARFSMPLVTFMMQVPHMPFLQPNGIEAFSRWHTSISASPGLHCAVFLSDLKVIVGMSGFEYPRYLSFLLEMFCVVNGHSACVFLANPRF